MSCKYETATFKVYVDKTVYVDVSVTGCVNQQMSLTAEQVREAGVTLGRIARAIQRIQKQIDHEQGKKASRKAA